MDEDASTVRNAVVIVIDRLGAGFLGPYGNTWIDTPAMNQLASESLLFEYATADSSDLNLLYRAYWSGVHALCRTDRPERSLATLVERGGLRATLLTDEAALLGHPLAADFGEQVSLDHDEPTSLAGTIEETRFAQLMLAAFEWLADAKEPGLLWLHSKGMNGPWDAPAEIAERFRDEDDPEAYAEITPPQWKLERSHDPDEVLRVMHAYAAQVCVIDACLGSLLEAIKAHELANDTLVLVTSPRGYPLGEHGRIGAGERDLFGETLNVPLLIQRPDHKVSCMRLESLVQPPDLYVTLRRWFGGTGPVESATGHDLLELKEDESSWWRQAAFAAGNNQRAVRTPAWFLNVDETAERSLYAKPDDRWEANEVADRCGDVAEHLAALIDEFTDQVNRAERVSLAPLSRELIEGIG
ncbi:MAG: sulfatase-like hydrolase/transferase [Planctomycetaceae bacterium]|nr:sulfatase-like hydrolase/transferase [Planctomycetales bacterium]MCB9921777.1 sulfatase-like hydrolase/transferase [Planctomycetaceae bacterium]